MKTLTIVARSLQTTTGLSLVFAIAALNACGGPGEQAGQACNAPDECYPDADPADIQGEILCLDKVAGGYCTHLCVTDDDCCAAPGECKTAHPQVCAPFESTGQMMCFLSCENDVLDGYEEGAYCHDFANEAFGCRSTGGGSANRKVCVP